MNKRVDAPAVLLCAPFATIAEGLARFAGKPDAPGAGRSLFVYGFPPEEEVGVLNRLRGLVATSWRQRFAGHAPSPAAAVAASSQKRQSRQKRHGRRVARLFFRRLFSVSSFG